MSIILRTTQGRLTSLLNGVGSIQEIEIAQSEANNRLAMVLKSANTLEQRKAESKANLSMLANGNINFIVTGE